MRPCGRLRASLLLTASTPWSSPARAVVTDRDVIYSHSRGELDRFTAPGAATEPPVTVRPAADLRHAAELMARFGTSHVVVTEVGGGVPIGILSSLDIAEAVAAV